MIVNRSFCFDNPKKKKSLWDEHKLVNLRSLAYDKKLTFSCICNESYYIAFQYCSSIFSCHELVGTCRVSSLFLSNSHKTKELFLQGRYLLENLEWKEEPSLTSALCKLSRKSWIGKFESIGWLCLKNVRGKWQCLINVGGANEERV